MEKKRKLLVVDDQLVNIAILKKLLSTEYDVLTADSGQKALDILSVSGAEISVVLLDIIMPGMNGYEVLAEIRKNRALSKLPVIVVTQPDGNNDEQKALELGATDFATKPYNAQILLRRLKNIIDLRETAEYANTVEKDPLTGLLNIEAFAHTAANILAEHPQQEYDIICSDIERFKLVNDLFGKSQGDTLLKFMADVYRKYIPEGSVYGRMSGDVFTALVPSDKLTESLIKAITDDVANYPLNITLALKTGVCHVDDRTTIIQNMCDRAVLAADSIKGLYDRYIAYYDDKMRQDMIREQFIVDNMRTALKENQFAVYFQPKYDLSTEKVAGAEALVRWVHPTMGFMSPGQFIPIFEDNGFISELDMFVWDKTCEYIRTWIDKYGMYVPVSVNVSRVDICNPDLPDILLDTVSRHGLEPKHIHLEITETAYTENSKQLIEVVGHLKSMGFAIEMDDFGSGYSSLNMLSELPINILKLDMALIQNDSLVNGSRNIVSFIISLAKWMNLLVVAEGVETVEQLQALRNMDCNYVQGYYYAKPMPAPDFSHYFEEKMVIDDEDVKAAFEKSGALIVGETKSDKTMLIVDDIPINRAILVDFFESSFNIVEANNGEVALDYINKHPNEIAIVLLDLVMPIMDGFQLLEKLSEDKKYKHIPVIVTSHPGDSNESRVLELGAKDFIGKPYNKAVAIRRVRHVLESSAYEQEHSK